MQNPSLRHVYASLAELNNTMLTGGATALTDAGNNALKLRILDAVSRVIDARAHRGSGFGPWIGTKSYDGNARSTLYLRADLAELDTLTIAPSQGATPAEPVVETDFYLAGIGGYDDPKRKLVLHNGTPPTFGSALRGVVVAGTWSFPYTTVVLEAVLADDVDDEETAIPVSALTGLSAGMTILVDDEQMFVTGTTAAEEMEPATLTVERAVNGTTIAEHDDEAAIARYIYDSNVHNCALLLAQKRWKDRDAGADGSDGGGDVGIVAPRRGEASIIRDTLGATIILSGQV